MAPDDDVHKDGFSFIWTIKNFSYCAQKRGEALESPRFMLTESDRDKWCLKLYGSNDSDTIALKLNYVGHSNGKEASFELSICTTMGIFQQEGFQKKVFNLHDDDEYGFHSTLRQRDLNKKGSSAHFNNDSLIVRCRIWEVNNKLIAFAQHHVRTTLVVERTTYIWNLKNYVELANNERPTKQPPITSEYSLFTLELSSNRRTFADNKMQIKIKRTQSVTKRLFTTCEISLLGVDEEIVHSMRDEHWFDKSASEQIWKIPFISRNKIRGRKELCLGTLSLRCELVASSGNKYNEVEIAEIGTADLGKFEDCKLERDPGSLKDNLKCFYAEGKFSDSTIRSPSKDFRVHKTILCARSEVFSAMFERDMKENQTAVVEIEDLDDDTVSKMLLFLYTDTVEDLKLETTYSLYFAADKYGIVALKRKCSDFLKDSFNVTNVCDVLVLADIHQDQELKSAAQSFIFEHSGEIMDSEEWKKFMQEKVSLALETMHVVLRKF